MRDFTEDDIRDLMNMPNKQKGTPPEQANSTAANSSSIGRNKVSNQSKSIRKSKNSKLIQNPIYIGQPTGRREPAVSYIRNSGSAPALPGYSDQEDPEAPRPSKQSSPFSNCARFEMFESKKRLN